MLSRNHRLELPTRMMWVDTETRNQDGKMASGTHSLWFGTAIYERYTNGLEGKAPTTHKLKFHTTGEFWDWVETRTEPKTRLWVMAHNWNYDAGILDTSTELLRRGWVLHKYINGKPPLIVSWRKNNCTILMVDTLNYFSGTLAFLGKAVGLEKLDMPGDLSDVEAWDTYCWRDVEIIRLAFLAFRAFVREHDLGVFQPTLASQSFTAFRHRFMEHDILIHSHADSLILERESYHGGRTESYWRGPVQEKIYKLDVNSMYPYLMKTYPMARKFIAYFPSYKPLMWKAVIGKFSVVAEVDIDTDIPAYSVVRKGRLIHPIGKFKTVLTTAELEYAIEHGHMKRVYRWAYFEREHLFTSFVDFFIGLRNEYKDSGNAAFSFLCKILVNSLYGKFGQNGRKWLETDDYVWASPKPGYFQETATSQTVMLRNRLGVTQILDTSEESENSLPMLASEITGYARNMLWRFIEQAGMENVYYVDTDSLLVNDIGLANLAEYVDQAQLGSLKVEWEGTVAEFWAPKDYSLDGKRTLKGVRPSARKIDETTYEQEVFRSWDYGLSQGYDGVVRIDLVTKHLTRKNEKAVVDGLGRTHPIQLEEF